MRDCALRLACGALGQLADPVDDEPAQLDQLLAPVEELAVAQPEH